MKDIKRVTIRMPDNIYQEMKNRADTKGNSVSSLIRDALAEYLHGGIRE